MYQQGTKMNMVKVTKIKKNFVGRKVPPKHCGAAGRAIENMFDDQVHAISRSQGADVPKLGLEIKTRDKDSTSPQTVAKMSAEDIVNTPYDLSIVCEKMQQQFRVKTQDQTIVDNTVYDFSKPEIQDLLRAAYENGRQAIAASKGVEKYVYGSKYGYFEKTSASNSYAFRLSDNAMRTLEKMALSNYHNLFR
jgi:hypothetical protein